jgi:hypothetical protein
MTLVVIATMISVWAWCVVRALHTPLPNRYTLNRRGLSVGVIADRDGSIVRLGGGDAAVSRYFRRFEVVSGELDSGEWFLLDTASGRVRVFDNPGGWMKAMSDAGAIPDSVHGAGPGGLGAVWVLGFFLLSLVLLTVGLVVEIGAAARGYRTRRLLRGDPSEVAIHGGLRRLRICPRCGYDLGGVEAIPCPECASVVHWRPMDSLRLEPTLPLPQIAMLTAIGALPSLAAGAWIASGRHSWSSPGILSFHMIIFGLFMLPGVLAWLLFVDGSGRVIDEGRRRRRLVSLLAIAWMWPAVYLAGGTGL